MADFEKCVAPNLKNTIALAEYSVEVAYLGDSKVPQDDAYRCTFELAEEASPPKAVNENDPIPLASEGKKYRILVHDNHGAKSTDTAGAAGGGKNVLGNGANTVSKPACYQANAWIRDVQPVVGFRVVVKKLAAGAQVTLSPDEVFVTWKIKDPEEEFDKVDDCMDPAKPKKFLKDFFKHFHRKTDDASLKGDDNCLTWFGGAREPDGVVDACKVLYQSPFNPAGPVLERQMNPAGMSKSDPYWDKLARSKVTTSNDADGKPIGISDVFFFPPGISGDNYVFCIGLVTKSGAVLEFNDPKDNKTKVYETGPFTMWRKLTMKLMVTFDNVDLAFINWTDVKNTYKAAFIEIVEPEVTVKYNEATWKAVVRDYLINSAGKAQGVVDGAAWTYGSYFLPALPGLTNNNCWNYGADLAKVFLDRAYKEKKMTPPARPVEDLDHPGTNKPADLNQDTNPGLNIFLCKPIQDGAAPIRCTVLGMYMGDREFFMVTKGDATCTFAHELGHAVYIRHSLTKFDGAAKVTIDNNDTEHIRGAWLDHDQDDAVACLMSYANDYYGPDGKTARVAGAVKWHFCATCLLKLRFYDTVALRGNRKFRNFIFSKMTPLVLADDHYANLANFNLANPGNKLLVCLANAEATTNNVGGPFKKDISNIEPGTDREWKSTQPAHAAFTTYMNGGVTYDGLLQAVAAGSTKAQLLVRVNEMKSNAVTCTVT